MIEKIRLWTTKTNMFLSVYSGLTSYFCEIALITFLLVLRQCTKFLEVRAIKS